MLAVLSHATLAAAQDDSDIERRKFSFAERSGKLVVSGSVAEIFDRAAIKRLNSGFPTTVVLRIYVYAADNRDVPVSFVLATFRVVYDLWEEDYTVRTDGPLGRKSKKYSKRKQALAAITEFDEFPLSPLSRIKKGPHYIAAMVVELNPVSKEMLAEMRRWLKRPAGATRLDSSSSFFGSFVSVFVNPKLQEADSVLKLQTQEFYRVDSDD
jgi:hypothetical protein